MKHIFMLEDDPDDRFITRSSIESLGYNVSITFFQDSNELYCHLETSQRPYLILVDYNSLPDNAVKILKKLKNDDRFKCIPIIVLGESTSSKYITECYCCGASSYVKKPTSSENTKDKIDSFFRYWIKTVEV
jgi:CheY-like chemotaxis protein